MVPEIVRTGRHAGTHDADVYFDGAGEIKIQLFCYWRGSCDLREHVSVGRIPGVVLAFVLLDAIDKIKDAG